MKLRNTVSNGRYDAVVVGAGPYGLSTAAHLQGRGLRVGLFGKALPTRRFMRHRAIPPGQATFNSEALSGQHCTPSYSMHRIEYGLPGMRFYVSDVLSLCVPPVKSRIR